jgi:hypothetical protein
MQVLLGGDHVVSIQHGLVNVDLDPVHFTGDLAVSAAHSLVIQLLPYPLHGSTEPRLPLSTAQARSSVPGDGQAELSGLVQLHAPAGVGHGCP